MKVIVNLGVERNKKPLKNIVYEVELSQLKNTANIESYEKYKFKDLGYIVFYWYYQSKNYIKNFHGFITIDELKKFIGNDQYSKFCQGKRVFIIQRRINKKNIKIKKNDK